MSLLGWMNIEKELYYVGSYAPKLTVANSIVPEPVAVVKWREREMI
jgi:hypothetical protein